MVCICFVHTSIHRRLVLRLDVPGQGPHVTLTYLQGNAAVDRHNHRNEECATWAQWALIMTTTPVTKSLTWTSWNTSEKTCKLRSRSGVPHKPWTLGIELRTFWLGVGRTGPLAPGLPVWWPKRATPRTLHSPPSRIPVMRTHSLTHWRECVSKSTPSASADNPAVPTTL